MRKQNNVKIKTVLWIIMVLIVDASIGYNILVVFPNPSRSHGNLGDGLVRHLLKAGHQVTYITPFVKSTPHHNLSYVDVSSTSKVYAGNPLDIGEVMKNNLNVDQHFIFHLMRNISVTAIETENVKKFLEHSNMNFDVVIAEWMFNELYSGFAAVFKCPYIWVFPFEPNFVALNLIDEPSNPAYAANLELSITPPFNFEERVRNLWFQISYKLKYYFHYDALEKAAYDSVFSPILMKKHGTVTPYDTLRYNASLIFSYSHYSLGQPLSIPQNLIPVGGYHVDDNPATLPEDLKSKMDNAKHGVIYFSMGSNLKSKSFPKNILQDLIKVFSELKYTVLWKFEGDEMEYSDNVHFLKWAPQQSILAHPNCILFITHGGLLSTIEALHYGVPVIGIPVFYDQFNNVDRAVKRGFAKKVTLSHDFAKDLKAAIEDIITDVRYAAKAKELAIIYHDRPVPPGATLVHWVHHVIATHGAPHLRSPSFSVPWYQKCYLDLLAVVIFLLFCTVWVLMKFFYRCKQYHVSSLRKKLA